MRRLEGETMWATVIFIILVMFAIVLIALYV